MPALSTPLTVWQYVNNMIGAPTQYTGILGSANTPNENPLAVQTLLDFCVSQRRTGALLYGIDSAPIWSGGVTLTASGKAVLRDFVSRCTARGIDVGIVWNAANVNFALALTTYNNTVSASEKIIRIQIENEFWSTDTSQTLLDQITVCNAVKAGLNSAGILIGDYLGFTHSAGYQYADDVSPIAYDEVTQLIGSVDVFCFHRYNRIPRYAYGEYRETQLTSLQTVEYIISDETPDNNASGGFDPANSYFSGWYKEGRNTAITPVAPGNAPPIIFSPKNLIDAYDYITKTLVAPAPAQVGTPVSYAAETDPNAVNNANIIGIIAFTWEFTYPLAMAAGLPPSPPPTGLIPYSNVTTHTDVLLLAILLTIQGTPPVNPQPTDYDLSSQTNILLYDILISMIAGLPPATGTVTPINITWAEKLAMDAAQSYVIGQPYNITNPTAGGMPQLYNFLTVAVTSSTGTKMLSPDGHGYAYDYNGVLYAEQLKVYWDFQFVISLEDEKLQVKISEDTFSGGNISLNARWGTWLDCAFGFGSTGGCIFTDSPGTTIAMQKCYWNGDTFSFNNFDLDFANVSSIGQNYFTLGANTGMYNSTFGVNNAVALAIDNNNLTVGNSIIVTGLLNNMVYGDLGSGCILTSEGLFDLNKFSVAPGISMSVYENQSYAFHVGKKSTWVIHILLSDADWYDAAGGGTFTYPDGYGFMLCTNDIVANAAFDSFTNPVQQPVCDLQLFNLTNSGHKITPVSGVDLYFGNGATVFDIIDDNMTNATFKFNSVTNTWQADTFQL